MRQRTGQAVEEVPEGMRLTPSVAAAAFNLEVGSPVRYFEIENHAMLRESFHSMKANLDQSGEGFIDTSSHTLRTATLENYSENSHLTVNVHSIIQWFRESVFPTQRYCSPIVKRHTAFNKPSRVARPVVLPQGSPWVQQQHRPPALH